MSATSVDEIYNQAKQLSPADRQRLFDRLLADIAPEPPHTFHSEAQLKQMLRVDISSGPATPMTEADWDDIRQEVRARATRRNRHPSSDA